MLEAKKSRWFERVFKIYNRNLLKRRFHSFRVSGLDNFVKVNSSIVYVNHSSWWDGLVAFEISKALRADSFIMMEEKHLRNLFLFRKLGAFSVVRENPRQSVKSLNYAVNLLKEKKEKTFRTLWIFPQGEILPNDSRPLYFYNGLAKIIERVRGCSAVPLAIRYEFLNEYKPEIFVKIGKSENFNNIDFNSKKLTRNFESRISKTLDEIKNDVVSRNFADYKKIF
jgi:1-acyl-sn-glycerol-3-phosphate acyltransferase